jgi:hypothetical protein
LEVRIKTNGDFLMAEIRKSKSLRRMGLKNIFFFSKALAAKNVWGIIQGTGLWAQLQRKNIFHMNLYRMDSKAK